MFPFLEPLCNFKKFDSQFYEYFHHFSPFFCYNRSHRHLSRWSFVVFNFLCKFLASALHRIVPIRGADFSDKFLNLAAQDLICRLRLNLAARDQRLLQIDKLYTFKLSGYNQPSLHSLGCTRWILLHPIKPDYTRSTLAACDQTSPYIISLKFWC